MKCHIELNKKLLKLKLSWGTNFNYSFTFLMFNAYVHIGHKCNGHCNCNAFFEKKMTKYYILADFKHYLAMLLYQQGSRERKSVGIQIGHKK